MSHVVHYRYRMTGEAPAIRWRRLEVPALDPVRIAQRVHRLHDLGSALTPGSAVIVNLRYGEDARPDPSDPLRLDPRSYHWVKLDRRGTMREQGGSGPWVWEVAQCL